MGCSLNQKCTVTTTSSVSPAALLRFKIQAQVFWSGHLFDLLLNRIPGAGLEILLTTWKVEHDAHTVVDEALPTRAAGTISRSRL